MKFSRKAQARWEGSGKEGSGNLTTASGVLENTPYSFKTRFENVKGTNPEELIGAAHAGCFTMQLSFLLGEAGYIPATLDTEATVNFEDGSIVLITLHLTGDVPDIKEEEFKKIAGKAKEICPVSKLLNTDIELDAKLSSR